MSRTPAKTFILAAASAILLLSAALSGPLRTVSGISINAALAITLAASAATVYFRGRFLNKSRLETILPFHRNAAAGTAVVLCLAAFSLLYYPPFGGLVSVGGGDSGNHLHYLKQFILRSPAIYQGFSSFFSTVYWLGELFGCGYYAAFGLSFFLTTFVLIACYCSLAALVFSAAAEPAAPEKNALRWLILVLLLILPAARIVLPSLHYLQADGFYPQLFGLVPLLIYWWAAARFARLPAGWAVQCAIILWYRYSYGLNLGDLLLAFAATVLWTHRGLERKNLWSSGAYLAAAAALVCGLYCYSRLIELLPISGAVLKPDILNASIGLLIIAAALGLSRLRQSAAINSAAFFFPAVFAAINGAVPLLLLASGFQPSYYLYKYCYHGVILGALSAVLLSALLATELLFFRRTAGNRLVNLLSLLLAFFGLYLLNAAYRPLMPSFLERARTEPAPQLIVPLTDSAAETKITAVLKSSGLQFGGLIAPSWPISNFINAGFDYYGELILFRHGSVKAAPGYCAFFISDPASIESYSAQKLIAVLKRIDELQSNPGVERFSYSNRETGVQMELSCLCLPRKTQPGNADPVQ